MALAHGWKLMGQGCTVCCAVPRGVLTTPLICPRRTRRSIFPAACNFSASPQMPTNASSSSSCLSVLAPGRPAALTCTHTTHTHTEKERIHSEQERIRNGHSSQRMHAHTSLPRVQQVMDGDKRDEDHRAVEEVSHPQIDGLRHPLRPAEAFKESVHACSCSCACVFVFVCVRACVCMCACKYVNTCVRACVRVCLLQCVRMFGCAI